MADAPHDVIVITTDQQRADFCAREGFGVDCTPTLDRLAGDGCWFRRAYTAAPVCVPARVSLLTGRFPSAHGARENHGYQSPRYTEDLMDLARTSGFRTAMIGKNHSHLSPSSVDDFVEYGHFGRRPRMSASGAAGDFDDWLLELGARVSVTPTLHPIETQLPARIVDDAVAWLDAGTAQRSLLWLSIPEPHVPYQVPEPYFSRYAASQVPEPATDATALDTKSLAWRWVRGLGQRLGESDPETLLRARANYVGMLRLIDDQIARLIQHLEDYGRLSRTLLVFLSDHGDFAGDYGLLRKGPELPEVLTRIPLSFTGPGVLPAGQLSSAHVSIVDVLPTLCELVGWPIPQGVQGRSLVPFLRGELIPEAEFDSVYAEQGVGGLPYDESDTTVVNRHDTDGGLVPTLSEVTQGGSLRMVRSGRWKLQASVSGRLSLFDLESDPYELVDRYGMPGYTDVTVRLLERLTAWLIRVDDPLPIPANGYQRKQHARNFHWVDGP